MIKLPNMILSTTSTLEGWTIKEYIGPVSAQVVAGTGLFSDVFASFSDVFGGRSESYRRQLSAINDEVTTSLATEATRYGANAVLGMRIDHDEVSGKGKSMFMVTASGTAVKAEKIHGSTGTALPDKTMSASELNVALRAAELLQEAEAEVVVWDDENMAFILENRLSEFIPYVLRDIASSYRTQAESHPGGGTENLKTNAMIYLASVPREKVLKGVYELLKQKEVHGSAIFEIMKSIGLLDFDEVLLMLKTDNLNIRKRALMVLDCEKPTYTEADVNLLSSLVMLIESSFPANRTIVEKKKTFLTEARQEWLCKENHENIMEEEFCHICNTDIYGFRRKEISPRQILPMLERKIEVLRTYFDINPSAM